MTNEEARKELNYLYFNLCDRDYPADIIIMYKDAIETAVNALEFMDKKEDCEGCRFKHLRPEIEPCSYCKRVAPDCYEQKRKSKYMDK